jgi:hypothetical protein
MVALVNQDWNQVEPSTPATDWLTPPGIGELAPNQVPSSDNAPRPYPEPE